MKILLLLLPLLFLASCDLGKSNNTTIPNVSEPEGYANLQDIAGYIGLNQTGDVELWVYSHSGNYGDYTAIVTGASHAELGSVTYAGYGRFRIERLDHTIDYWNTTLAIGNVIVLDAGLLGIFYIQI